MNAPRPLCKVISGLGSRDVERVRRLAALYSLAGADWLDVAMEPEVVAAAVEGIAWAEAQGGRRLATRIMVSCGLDSDPHIGSALLDVSVCATCSACVIADLKACASRPLEVRAPECPSCQACIGACPYGAIRTTPAGLRHLDACLAAGATGLELHVAGASHGQVGPLLQHAVEHLPADACLSLSVGAGVHDDADLREIVADLNARDRRPWLLQVEGAPMSHAPRDGQSEAMSLDLVRKVLSWQGNAPVLVAGGTGMHTARLCREQGLAVAGISFGTAARLAIAPALQVDVFALSEGCVRDGLASASALVRSCRTAWGVP